MIDLGIFEELKTWGDSNSVDFNYISGNKKPLPFAVFLRVADLEEQRDFCNDNAGDADLQVSFYDISKERVRTTGEVIKEHIKSLLGEINTTYGDFIISDNRTQGVIVLQETDLKTWQANILFTLKWVKE